MTSSLLPEILQVRARDHQGILDRLEAEREPGGAREAGEGSCSTARFYLSLSLSRSKGEWSLLSLASLSRRSRSLSPPRLPLGLAHLRVIQMCVGRLIVV